MCAGPPDASGANTVTVIDEAITYRMHRQPGSLHSVSVEVLAYPNIHSLNLNPSLF